MRLPGWLSGGSKQARPEIKAIGRDALDACLQGLHPGQKPHDFVPEVLQMFGGDDPLDKVSAWQVSGPVPHWLYVSYGFSELYEKDSPFGDVSGFGFELTLRLARTSGETTPPTWPVAFLQAVARYVFRTGNVFDSGHFMDLGEPIDDAGSVVTAVGFSPDSRLGVLQTPLGAVRFLQVIGLTTEEGREVGEGSADGVIARLREGNSLGVMGR